MFTEKFFEGPGASTMTTYVWEIAVILLGAFILGYLLRLMLNSKYKTRIEDLELQLENLKAKKVEPAEPASMPFDTTEYDVKIRDQRREIDQLNLKLSEYQQAKISAETSFDSLKKELEELKLRSAVSLESNVDEEHKIETPSEEVQSAIEVVESQVDEVVDSQLEFSSPVEQKSADIIENSSVERDDLKKIEGIGPKIELLLNNAGIFTYKQLKEASPDYIREVLVAAGPNYAVHDPATWSEQATLANNGNWDALARLQEVLKGGKRK